MSSINYFTLAIVAFLKAHFRASSLSKYLASTIIAFLKALIMQSFILKQGPHLYISCIDGTHNILIHLIRTPRII